MRFLETSVTAVLRTIGWRRASALGLAFAAACSGADSPAGPGGDASTPVGTYTIATVNGKALPVAVFDEPPYLYEVIDGRLSLTADGKYTAVTSFRQTVPGSISIFRDSTFGTWTRSGAQIVLKNAQDAAATSAGTWADRELTFVMVEDEVTLTYVYRK